MLDSNGDGKITREDFLDQKEAFSALFSFMLSADSDRTTATDSRKHSLVPNEVKKSKQKSESRGSLTDSKQISLSSGLTSMEKMPVQVMTATIHEEKDEK